VSIRKRGSDSSTPRTPPDEVLKPALRLLSSRARSVRELRNRLLKKGMSPGDVEYALRWLEERDLLDDGAFAGFLVRDRLRFSPRSPLLLQRELRRKGVDPSLAERVVESVLLEEDVSVQDLAVKAARAWVRKQSPSTRRDLLMDRFSPEREKARRRLYGFLSRRGFAGDPARNGMEAAEEEARRLEDD
jgi:regulatory protein